MNKKFSASTTAMLFGMLAFAGALLTGGPAGGAAVPPPTLLPLNQIPVPEPPNLFQFVKSKPAAIKLGKALFWDMQAGSDGVQACASCHFSAGADNRRKNTVNPGTRAGDSTFQVKGPNGVLQDTDFPFHQRQVPDLQASLVLRDFNDVVGSQGVKFTRFVNIVAGNPVEAGVSIPDTVFQLGGLNMRRVTARNTPTNINAIFNFNNFWDGRAHFLFNGVNPFGPLDPSAGVWFNVNNSIVKQKVAIEFGSLASQATGPPLDDTEMSFQGRTFPQLGRKMLSLIPLGQQSVHPNDSVLGPFSRAIVLPDGKLVGDRGLTGSYSQMIRDAFQNNLWNSIQITPDGFTQMEANFSLFWGLAIQLYEATLVSDQTPFDRFLGGDRTALTAQQQDGFNIFFGGAGRCDACHGGSELTSASVRAALFVTNSDHALIDQMPVASGQSIIYDLGYNNTAVRPSTEDIGREGVAPFTNPLTGLQFPLSFSRLAELMAIGNLPFATPILPAQLPVNFPVANNGAFKAPGLRNIELTGPYFHNGDSRTLEEVVDFYTRGGNFPAENINDLDFNIAQIGTLQNSPVKQAALVAFMNSFTDERVRNESAPFDHPELFIPNGDPEVLISIPARDANGNAAVSIAITIDPVTTPTNRQNLPISGKKEVGATVQVKVGNGLAVTAGSPTATTWSVTLVGLAEGINNIAVSSTDLNGIITTATTIITLDTTLPLLNLTPVPATLRGDDMILSGTVETGIIPVVTVSTPGAAVGTVTITGAAWSAPVSLLTVGANGITVTATDLAGNVTSANASIFMLADGIFNGTRVADISDAIKALRIAVNLITPTANDLLHGDVAPLGLPDGNIDLSDVLLIMRNVVGTINLSN